MIDFTDSNLRRQWIQEKEMVVFSCWHPRNIAEIDVFLESPFDFDAAWADAYWAEVAPGLPAAFVDYERLLNMKRQAGRAKDKEDIELLQQIRAGGRYDG